MDARKPDKLQWAVGLAAILLITFIMGIIFFSYSGSPAEIVQISHYPAQPQPGDIITIEVVTQGGGSLIAAPQLEMGFGAIGFGTGAGTGGANLFYLGDNKYGVKIGPFENEMVLWYIVKIEDRGHYIFSDPLQIQISNASSALPISVENCEIFPMWTYNQSSNNVMATFLVSVNSTKYIEGTFTLLGFTPNGWSFGYSSGVTHLENNTYVVTFYPEKQLWVTGTNIFYRFSYSGSDGTLRLSNVEGTIIW